MWLSGVLQTLLALSVAEPSVPVPPEGPPPLLATRQTAFSIPFRTDNQPPGAEVVEVQLFLSTDQGATWQLYQRTGPSAGKFLFQTRGDGEYWFLLKTVDRSGVVRPRNNNTPRLRVVVDTVPPDLKLAAARGEGGQVQLQWQMAEPHPNPGTLKIQYRLSGAVPWQSVAIDPRGIATQPGLQSGQLAWWPQASEGRVEIRGEVSDAAGNSTVTHQQVSLDLPANTASLRGSPLWAPPGTSGGPAKSSPPDPTALSPESGPVLQINPPLRENYGGPGATPVQTVAPVGAPSQARVVNSPLFELDYDVDAAGPTGIRRVELWGTLDGGRTWSSFGVDDDNRSPMLVRVQQEGVFGFRIAAQSGSGFGSAPPKPGDTPDLWIAVDLTRPNARLLAVEQGQGDQAGQLVIRWQAEDRQLGARPISFHVSGNPAGPWVPIATNLDNSGQYGWPIDNRVPELQSADHLYLRMEVRDEAGNSTLVDANHPIPLDHFRPNVRIREIRPISSAPAPNLSTGSTQAGPLRVYFR